MHVQPRIFLRQLSQEEAGSGLVRLKSVHDGDRQMVTILGCVPTDGLAAFHAACQEPLDHGLLGLGDHQHSGPQP